MHLYYVNPERVKRPKDLGVTERSLDTFASLRVTGGREQGDNPYCHPERVERPKDLGVTNVLDSSLRSE